LLRKKISKHTLKITKIINIAKNKTFAETANPL